MNETLVVLVEPLFARAKQCQTLYYYYFPLNCIGYILFLLTYEISKLGAVTIASICVKGLFNSA